MRGYESAALAAGALRGLLRIPMRGYEIMELVASKKRLIVTNPHAGL